MEASNLQIIWFLLLGVLLIGYAILDGFDLGVGILHPFVAKSDRERRISMNSIGPLWDGNEVWLVTFGGALFAAFPNAYATVFSGFYTAFMALLFALIFRAVSLEFRSKVEGPRWRRFWDWCFFGSSFLATFLFGVAVGNAMVGMPLDTAGSFNGSIIDQVFPYSIVTGLFAVAMFTMHGGVYLYLKTEGEFQERIRVWMWRGYFLFLVMYGATTAYTLAVVPHATANFEHHPIAWLAVIGTVLAVANVPRCLHKKREGRAFLSSCVAIAGAVALLGIALFPNLVLASNDPDLSITLMNGASSPKTLKIMLVIACVGMPFVLVYTGIIYWAFRGKVRLDKNSY